MKRKSKIEAAHKTKEHPDHASEIHRINRIKGQLDGVGRMIESRRYCPDIIAQLDAVRAAVTGLQSAILSTHLQECVTSAFCCDDAKEKAEKIEELLTLFKKRL